MKKLPLLIIIWLISGSLFAQSTGTLQLHPDNPHYFLYQNQPTVIIGSGEHYGAVVNLDFDYTAYLQTLAQDSLNHTRLFTGAYVEQQGDFGIANNTLAPPAGRLIVPWKRSTTPGYALGGNKFDLNQWNTAYFARLKDFVAKAQRQKVIVEITLFSAHYAEGWNYSAFNPTNNVNQTDRIASAQVNTLDNGNVLEHQERYVRKIVRELNAFDNLYYEIQNEPWAEQPDRVLVHNAYGPEDDWRSTLQVVSQQSNDWQRQVAEWIEDEERELPKQHLISQNISNFHYPITDPDPRVSIFTFHYASPEAVYENYYLNRALGFNETGFAGSADATYRRQAWRFLMAGGSLFSHLDYSFSVGSEDGKGSVDDSPGGGSPALRQQFGVLKHFFEMLDFVQLRPDPDVVVAAPGAATQALSNDESQWVIYLEPLAIRSYDLMLDLPEGNYTAVWRAVLTGEILETVKVDNGKLPVPSVKGDKVVTLKKVE